MLHTRGKDNVVADTLSRMICSTQVDAIDLSAIARCQKTDAETQSFKDKLNPYQLSTFRSIYSSTVNLQQPPQPITSGSKLIEQAHSCAVYVSRSIARPRNDVLYASNVRKSVLHKLKSNAIGTAKKRIITRHGHLKRNNSPRK